MVYAEVTIMLDDKYHLTSLSKAIETIDIESVLTKDYAILL